MTARQQLLRLADKRPTSRVEMFVHTAARSLWFWTDAGGSLWCMRRELGLGPGQSKPLATAEDVQAEFEWVDGVLP